MNLSRLKLLFPQRSLNPLVLTELEQRAAKHSPEGWLTNLKSGIRRTNNKNQRKLLLLITICQTVKAAKSNESLTERVVSIDDVLKHMRIPFSMSETLTILSDLDHDGLIYADFPYEDIRLTDELFTTIAQEWACSRGARSIGLDTCGQVVPPIDETLKLRFADTTIWAKSPERAKEIWAIRKRREAVAV